MPRLARGARRWAAIGGSVGGENGGKEDRPHCPSIGARTVQANAGCKLYGSGRELRITRASRGIQTPGLNTREYRVTHAPLSPVMIGARIV